MRTATSYRSRGDDITMGSRLWMMKHTEEHMKGFINPPSQENEEWHPEKGELDA